MDRTNQHGFALPLTVYVLAIVTILLAAIFVRAQADRRVATSSGDLVDALTIAQAGLSGYMGTVTMGTCGRALRPQDGDSVRVNVVGGYADVVARVVRRPADTLAPWVYVIRARGVSITPTQGADPQAVRTVAQFALWQPTHMRTLAAYTAVNGIEHNPKGGGSFDGTDGATPSTCRIDDVPALYVAGEKPEFKSGSYNTKGSNPEIATGGDAAAVAQATGIDWPATVAGGLVPDYTSVRLWDTSYPITLIAGDATIDAGAISMGWGTLVVTGNLTIIGTNFFWYGLVLVGGEINFRATNHRFYGAVVSGLNEMLPGEKPEQNDLGDNNLRMYFDSERVRLALSGFAGFAPLQNAYVDNWVSY